MTKQVQRQPFRYKAVRASCFMLTATWPSIAITGSARSICDVPKFEDRAGVLDHRGRPSRLVLRVAPDVGGDEQCQAVRPYRHVPVPIHRLEMRVLVGLADHRRA